MTLWVTRAEPDNLATARRLRAMGYGSIVVPVLRTRAIDHDTVAGRPDAIVFTSAHAVRHHRRPEVNDTVAVFAASEGVACAARSAGYANITSTGDDAEILTGLLAHVLPPGGRLIEFCARRTSPALSHCLSGRGFRVDHVPVYDVAPVDPADLGDVSFQAGVGGIVVHSCGGARALRRIIEHTGWRGPIWCISPASALILDGLDGIILSWAAAPTERDLMALVEREALPTRWPTQSTAGRAPLWPVPIRLGTERGWPGAANDTRPGDGPEGDGPLSAA
jgi:uroporphyrinogen-III synthase